MKDDGSMSLLGFLLPGIIHEFKNVLNRIHLLSEYGLQTASSAEERRHSLESITAQVEHADSIVIGVINRLLEALERSKAGFEQPRQDYVSDRAFDAGSMYNADFKPESAPTGTGSDCFLRSSEDVAVFFRILRSTCKRREVNMTTWDLPSAQILSSDQTCFLLLIDACRAVCAIGGAVDVDFPAGEDLTIEIEQTEMRTAITLPEKIEPELCKKFKSEIVRIFDRRVMEVDNLDWCHDEDGSVSGQSNQVKLEVRIKLKGSNR